MPSGVSVVKSFITVRAPGAYIFSSVFPNNQDGNIGMPLGLNEISGKLQLMGLFNQLLQLLGSLSENLIARRKTNSADGQLF